MTSVFSLLTSVSIYLLYQYFKFNSVEEECNTSGQKSNVCSKVIYLCGVLLFLYRFERQPWRRFAQPLRLIFDALSVLLAFEFLYSFLWQKVEFFFLEVVPTLVNNTLKSSALFSRTPTAEWPYVIPLLLISLLFVCFAHNSDIYIDYYLQLDESVEPSDEYDREGVTDSLLFVAPPSMSSGGYGEPAQRVGSLFQSFPQAPSTHTHVSVAARTVRSRGAYTLTDTPLRRSNRLHSRQNLTDMQY